MPRKIQLIVIHTITRILCTSHRLITRPLTIISIVQRYRIITVSSPVWPALYSTVRPLRPTWPTPINCNTQRSSSNLNWTLWYHRDLRYLPVYCKTKALYLTKLGWKYYQSSQWLNIELMTTWSCPYIDVNKTNPKVEMNWLISSDFNVYASD